MNQHNVNPTIRTHHSILSIMPLVRKIASGYSHLSKLLEKLLPILTLTAFIAGIGLAMVSTSVGEFVTNGMDSFIGFYGYIAPFIIFIILAPALARIIEAKKGKFASYVLLWFSARRLIACVWASIFTVLAFGFPLFAGASSNISQAIFKTLKSLGWMATHSSYFYAMYAAIAVVFISTKVQWISRLLNKFCQVKEFSIKKYFKKYWIRVYPLLWATSSEAIATPLNLYLVKKYFPHIKDEVRRFVIGIGSYVSINGTMICVLVLAGAVASLLGVQLSLLQLLLCVPIVFLIGFGVPGIPGELLLFAGPVVMMLEVPEAILPAFMALYLGLQLGLPDSFRTGSNSSDDSVNANFLNEIYIKKYTGEKLPEGIKEEESCIMK